MRGMCALQILAKRNNGFRRLRSMVCKPFIIALLSAVLLATMAAVLLPLSSSSPHVYPVASADGKIAPPQLAFSSEQFPTIMKVVHGDKGAQSYPDFVGSGYGDQPSGSNGQFVFITHELDEKELVVPENVNGQDNVYYRGELDGEVAYIKDGTPARVLTHDNAVDAEPDLSPDGKRVVYASLRDGAWDLWVIGVDGTAVTRLTHDAAQDSWPRWSPDGKMIVFSSTRDDPAGDIYTIPASGGVPTRLTSDPAADTQPAWSRNGKIAFTTSRWQERGDIAVMSSQGRDVTRITSGRSPVWSLQAENTITFVDGEEPGLGGKLLNVKAERGATPVAVRSDTRWHGYHPAWLDSSTLIAVIDGGEDESYTKNIWSVDRSGANLTDLTKRPERSEQAPAYSPDGRLIAYQEEVNYPGAETGFAISIADADGRNRRQLTRPGFHYSDLDPIWSSDGKTIIFARKYRKAISRYESVYLIGEITAVDAQTGEHRFAISCDVPDRDPYRDRCNDGEPALSPDGKRLVFTRTVTRVPSRSSEHSLFSERASSEAPNSKIMSINMVNNRYTGTSRTLVSNVVRRETPTASPSSGSPHDIATDSSPTWSPDGTWIAFTRNSQKLMRVRFDGRDLQELPSRMSSDGREILGYRDPVYAPDGKSLVFSGRESVEKSYTYWDIYSIGSEGGAATAVLRLSGEDSQPVFRPSADIGVTLQATPTAIPFQGSGAKVQMSVTNRGWYPAHNTTVELAIPEGLRVGGVRSSSGTCSSTGSTCSLGTVAVGSTATITVDVVGVRSGMAAVTGKATSSLFDPDLSDNTARTSILVNEMGDVSVSVSANPAIGYVGGDPVVVVYTVTNRGGSPVREVSLTMDLPMDLVTSIEISPSGNDKHCSIPQGICTLGTIPAVGSQTPGGIPGVVTVTATLNPGREINTLVRGTVSASGDSDAMNNVDQTRIRIFRPSADIGVTLQATPRAIPFQGSGAKVQMSVTNRGWYPAHNTTVELAIPEGLRVGGVRSSSGTCSSTGSTCSLGTLAVGSTATITVDVVGVRSGVAAVTGKATSSVFDPDLSNNTASTSILVNEMGDVSVSVSANPAIGYVGGDPVVVVYTVTNRGGSPVREVGLMLDLPRDLVTSVEISPSGNDKHCSIPQGFCTLGIIPVMGSQTPGGIPGVVTITVTLNPSREISTLVRGTISAFGDSNTMNNVDQVGVRILQPTIVVTPQSGEAGFVPKVMGANFPPGGLITLTWNRGITQKTMPIVVKTDGTFIAPMMVFNRDLLGARILHASRDPHSPPGTRFSPVSTGYFVASGHDQPKDWLYRR